MKPKILLATTCRWFSAARLVMAFADSGCQVEIVAPPGHPATKAKALAHRHSFRGLAPYASFRAAIKASQPDLVVPCDDLSTLHLQHLCSTTRINDSASERVVNILLKSLGPAEVFPTIASRSNLIGVAHSEGVRAPATARIDSLASLDSWTRAHGFPLVLKSDGSAGGRGVQVVRTPDEAKRAFLQLSEPPLVARAIKRALFDQDRTLIQSCLQRQVPTINAQSYVLGRDATTSVACWKGRILASISVEVVRTQSERGPASVLRVINHAEMSTCAERIVRRLSLSGLLGFDFVVDETGDANLIEMNARATQTCHLPLGTGRNLPLALACALNGQDAPVSTSVTDRNLIALIQEWQSNPASAYLHSAFHDVPWSEPRLVKICVDQQISANARFSPRRMVDLYKNIFQKND